ncbi:AraC family transcriptional regulator [Lihuaxuella thermophila]|uniref:AraC-like ligand binding domain-containing protein n=1 Tax=Lihuaxuella thermophila TaxID=1173111 RepID=A0A1H8FJ36_9BACL|nr:AraC family transcriptional regulator [Lihuaxuella thermophila]SEN31088.1 AraC-like ligand binding domain-containing protein [Lihuaxuella thermophila]
MSQQPYFYRTYSHSASETAKKVWFHVHSVGWFSCTPDYDVKRKSFYDYQIKYVVRGSGTVVWQGRSYRVGPRELFFLDLNQEHRYFADPDDPWEVLWVHFGGPQSAAYYQLLEGRSSPVYHVSHPVQVEAYFRRLYHLFGHRPIGMEPRASALINCILTEMIVTRMESGVTQPGLDVPQYPDAIRRAIYYMEHHFHEPLKLNEIAQKALLSPFHFSRLFKQSTGYSVMEYLLKFRLTQAKQLLVETQLTISEIAEKVGFSDQSYFGKVFKRYEKLTPKEFRLTYSKSRPLPHQFPL